MLCVPSTKSIIEPTPSLAPWGIATLGLLMLLTVFWVARQRGRYREPAGRAVTRRPQGGDASLPQKGPRTPGASRRFRDPTRELVCSKAMPADERCRAALELGRDHAEYGRYALGRLSGRTVWAISVGASPDSPSLRAKGDPRYPNEDGLLAVEDGRSRAAGGGRRPFRPGSQPRPAAGSGGEAPARSREPRRARGAGAGPGPAGSRSGLRVGDDAADRRLRPRGRRGLRAELRRLDLRDRGRGGASAADRPRPARTTPRPRAPGA